MKKILLPALAALALLVSACDKQSSVNSPAADPSVSVQKMLTTVDLTTDQIAVVDEMFYLGEDLSLVLPPAQAGAIEEVTGSTTGIMGDNTTFDRRRAIDMEALIYLALIKKANPDIDPATIAAIKKLIVENYKSRIEAIKNAGDPAALKALLKQLHEKLMADITALLSPGQLKRVEDLKALILKQREEIRMKMEQIRIDRQVLFMTRALGLTAEQAKEVKDILIARLLEVKDLRKAYVDDPEGFRLALKDLMKKYDDQLAKVLGPDLWAKWMLIRSGKR